MSRIRTGAAVLTLTAALTAALAGAVLAGIALGSVPIPPGRVLSVLLGTEPPGPLTAIVWDVRLPRILLGALVGAGLALTGAVLQALVRNPLADPFLLGASSGASAGAVAVIVLGGSAGLLGGLGLPAAAFLGAFAALLLVHVLARREGGVTGGRLVLAGVAVQYVLSALTSLVLVLGASADEVRAVLFWTLGGLGGARWDALPVPLAALLLGGALLIALARPLDLLLAGEEDARTLGLNTGRFRALAFVLTSLVIGVLVAQSGAIGFVGLMVPHAVRLVVGAGHRALLPVSALAGAAFLVWADLLARTAAAPREIPVGVITALVGGPFFLWLLRRGRRARQVLG
ncbi:FecCD family ABC transporter permease [Streptomyces sp. BI20]|uniref:FecCD family ABC transporter permease n=1 Tax=Streptomyces sp. BI20 TaxID=3403460 RepID=UPI003C7250F5